MIFYDLAYPEMKHYCEIIVTRLEHVCRDAITARETGRRDVRSESVSVLHVMSVMQATEHSRPEQNRLSALYRPGPAVTTLWLLDIRDS